MFFKSFISLFTRKRKLSEPTVEPLTDYELNEKQALESAMKEPEDKELIEPINLGPVEQKIKRKKNNEEKNKIRAEMDLMKQQMMLQRDELAFLRSTISSQKLEHDVLKHNVTTTAVSDKIYRKDRGRISFI